MKRFIIDMEQSPLSMFLLLSIWFVFMVTYTANEYSTYHFSIMIKDFSISFSRVIIVQDFETVTFYVLFGYKQTSFIFCCMKRVHVSSQFNGVFILYFDFHSQTF